MSSPEAAVSSMPYSSNAFLKLTVKKSSAAVPRLPETVASTSTLMTSLLEYRLSKVIGRLNESSLLML